MGRKKEIFVVLFICFAFSAGGWTQQFDFHRKVNTIQVYASDVLIHNPFAGGIDHSFPVFADIDGDADWDLFVGDASGHIQFYRNNGKNGDSLWFELIDKKFLLIDTESFSAPAFADIDADGDVDLFIGNGAGGINFFINAGSVTEPAFAFQTKSFVPFHGKNSTLSFVDIDNDKDLDLFIGEKAGKIQFYMNVGTAHSPSFALQSNKFAGIQLEGFSTPIFANIDGDSDFDLFIGRQNGKIEFFKNKGTKRAPVFERQKGDFGLSDYGSFSKPAFIDIDGDGDLDFFVGEESGNVNFIVNAGTVREPQLIPGSESFTTLDLGRWSAPVFADIDNDADFDFFVGESDGEISFFRNTGSADQPVFILVTKSFLQSDSFKNIIPIFVDIDSDGDLDLFVGQHAGTISFFRNTGNTNEHRFVLEIDSLVTINGQNSFPAFVDIDSDGDLDLFVGVEEGTISFYRNQRNATDFSFVLVSARWLGIDVGSVSSPVFADIDQDGDSDLIVGENNGKVNFFRNFGAPDNPVFASEPEDFTDIDVGRVSKPAFVDIDSDGDLDLFVGEEEGGIYFYSNETLYTGVTEILSHHDGMPGDFLLAQNFPNPFNPATVIRYQIPKNTHVKLNVYNILGQKVAELIDRFQTAGYYAVSWDGKDDLDRELSGGIYFYRLETKAFRQARKLTLLR